MDKKYKIAIVDDESEILQMLSRFFQRSGKYEVITFLNPIHAISSIDNTFDAVMLDIMMAQMGGLEALEKIIEKNPDQKVIMMTAYSTLDKVLKSHKVGATHYIMKPFNSLESVEKKLIEVLQG